MHKGSVYPGMSVLVHDDLLATGGTACAGAELIKSQGGILAGFAFLIELEMLSGRNRLLDYDTPIISMLSYA
jgi:adenine phosphoribosyltransferase